MLYSDTIAMRHHNLTDKDAWWSEVIYMQVSFIAINSATLYVCMCVFTLVYISYISISNISNI